MFIHLQAYLRKKDDRKVLTTKSDVWSASTTMMHVLEGKYKNKEQYREVCTFVAIYVVNHNSN